MHTGDEARKLLVLAEHSCLLKTLFDGNNGAENTNNGDTNTNNVGDIGTDENKNRDMDINLDENKHIDLNEVLFLFENDPTNIQRALDYVTKGYLEPKAISVISRLLLSPATQDAKDKMLLMPGEAVKNEVALLQQVMRTTMARRRCHWRAKRVWTP